MANEITRAVIRHWHSMRVDKADAPVGFADKVAELVRRQLSVDVRVEESGERCYYSWRFRQQIDEADRLILLKVLRDQWPDADDRVTWCWYGTETTAIVTEAVAMNQYVNGKE